MTDETFPAWRPIETAPENKMVYLVRFVPERPQSLWYVSAGKFQDGYWWTEDGNGVDDPTHWAPIIIPAGVFYVSHTIDLTGDTP